MAYKHITYMGAYSLKTWIRKIFQKEIELPPYQRDFEWDLKNAKDLKESLEKGYYIPPITLAKYRDNGDEIKTYLLDGQQRLTSIICLYLGVWPKNKINAQDDDEEKFFSEFTFKVLQDLELGNIKNLLEKPDEFRETILKNESIYLEKQELKIKDIESIFLPYCLIMPNFNNTERREEKEFFAETFRRINTSGKALSDRELRRSIFWIYENIEKDIYTKSIDDFEKKLEGIKTFQDNNDFLIYLATICDFKYRYQYAMKSYNRGKKFDRYIVDFLLCCGKEEYNDEIWTKENIECIKNNQKRFNEAKKYFLDFFNKNSKSKENNISYQDIYLFSFTYYIYFTKKEVNEKAITDLLNSARDITNDYLDEISKDVNEKERYSKQPNALKRIRERLLLAHQIICPEEYKNE